MGCEPNTITCISMGLWRNGIFSKAVVSSKEKELACSYTTHPSRGYSMCVCHHRLLGWIAPYNSTGRQTSFALS